MAFKKRLSTEERAKKRKQRLIASLPKGWKAALNHKLLRHVCAFQHFDPTPENILEAIAIVKSFRGASDIQKVFVLAFDIVLEKGTGEGVLSPDAYNRLWDHLISNENKLDYWSQMIWRWDIYHDSYGLTKYEPGQLALAEPPRKIKLKRKLKRK
jgi:hypothetical protein